MLNFKMFHLSFLENVISNPQSLTVSCQSHARFVSVLCEEGVTSYILKITTPILINSVVFLIPIPSSVVIAMCFSLEGDRKDEKYFKYRL